MIERNVFVTPAARLSYLVAGDPQHQPILLLHGIPASAELWRYVIPRLVEQGYYVIAPDLPGYGQTQVLDEHSFSLPAAASLLAQLIEQVVGQPVWLVAHDIGGGVAQILVSDSPHWVQQLTLSNCIAAGTWPVLPIKMLIAIARLRLYPLMASLRLLPNPYVSWELKRSVHNTQVLTKDTVKRVFWDNKITDKVGQQQFARHLQTLAQDMLPHYNDKLYAFDKPVQLLWAMDDPNQPWTGPGQQLAKGFKQPRIDQLPQAGHFWPLEKAQAGVEALLNWGA